jgi:hypothetical protein
MKLKELIAELSRYNPELDVYHFDFPADSENPFNISLLTITDFGIYELSKDHSKIENTGSSEKALVLE